MVTKRPVVPPVYRPGPAAPTVPRVAVGRPGQSSPLQPIQRATSSAAPPVRRQSAVTPPSLPPVFRVAPSRLPAYRTPAIGPAVPPAYRAAPSPCTGSSRSATRKAGAVQCAYFARRALGGVLGGGDMSENPQGKGIFHEHVFFEDGQDPKDLGFFSDGLHSDTQNKRLYNKLGGAFGGVFDDGIMRIAVSENDNPGAYSLLGNNCQVWVTNVLASYNKVAKRYGDTSKSKTHTPHWIEMS